MLVPMIFLINTFKNFKLIENKKTNLPKGFFRQLGCLVILFKLHRPVIGAPGDLASLTHKTHSFAP